MKRILIPLDGSETAEAVLPQVTSLLTRSSAEVILLRALGFPELRDPVYRDVTAELWKKALGYLEEKRAELKNKNIEARCIVSMETPATAILETSEKERADLIAMTTHGRGGPARWAFGSVADKLIRASNIPIFLTRAYEVGDTDEPTPSPTRTLKRMLIPIDGSERSMQILPHAAELCKLLDLHVTLLHVFLESPLDPEWIEPAHQLDAARAWLDQNGIHPTTEFLRGNVTNEILEYIRRQGVDLIAMSTHGYGGLSRWVLGSVTDKLLRTATLPMFVVRSRAEPKQAQKHKTGTSEGVKP